MFTTFSNGTLTVTQAPLTVAANSGSKTYGQTVPPTGFGFTPIGLLNGDTVTNVTLTSPGFVATALVSGSPYGIVPSAALGTGLSNYTISYSNGTCTVLPTRPVVTWTNPAPIVYGTPLGTNQLNPTASVPGNATASVAGDFVYIPTNGAVFPAGTNTLSAVFTPTDSTEYSGATSSVSMVVLQAPLTVTASDTNRPYGAPNPEFTASYAGFTNGDTASVVGGQPAFTTTAAKSSPVGGYSIVPSAGTLSAANYTFTNFVNGTLSVTPDPLTVTPNSMSKTYGQNLPFGPGSTAFTAIGLQNGETVGSVTLTCAGGAATAHVGVYAITLSNPTGGTFNPANYAITPGTGTLTVLPVPPTVAWTNPAPIPYGTPLGTNQLNATANVDGVSVAGIFVYVPTNGAVLPAGTNTLSAVFTPTDSDYSTLTSSVRMVVMQAPLSVKVNNTNMPYGGPIPVFTWTYIGFTNGDSGAVVTGQPAFSTSATTTSPIGIYLIVPSLGTLSASNYTFTNFTSGLLTVDVGAIDRDGQQHQSVVWRAQPGIRRDHQRVR